MRANHPPVEFGTVRSRARKNAYKDIYRLCYVRGPEGIIVELAEQIG